MRTTDTSYPAGNSDWAWRWMGMTPPNTCYNSEEIDEKYRKFSNCFDAYYGIGDFDYWKRNELNSLSDDDKMSLIKYLLADLAVKDEKYAARYIGIVDDTLNLEIDPFADAHHFFKKLTVDECRQQKYPHNRRERNLCGFHCNDCETFFGVTTDDYVRSEGVYEAWRFLHNIKIYVSRATKKIPEDIVKCTKYYDKHIKPCENTLSIDVIKDFLMVVNKLKRKYKKYINENK